MKREDTYEVRVEVAGRDLGVWDKQSGGETDSEESTYKRGGIRGQVSLGGSQTVGNVTVQRLYEEDVHDVYHWLAEQAGEASVIVSRIPLVKGRAFGRPLVWTGTLKSVTPPDVDSEGNGAALISLEMTCNGGVS
jgi:hypothetical protein